MKTLHNRLTEQSKMESSTDDQEVKKLVNMISETGLDFICSERLTPNTSDNDINDAIDGVSNAFYTLTKILKRKGFIDINGYQITLKNNI